MSKIYSQNDIVKKINDLSNSEIKITQNGLNQLYRTINKQIDFIIINSVELKKQDNNKKISSSDIKIIEDFLL